MQESIKPLFVFGTRHGTTYNLTPTNLPNLPGIQLSLGDFYDNKETIKDLPANLSLRKFLGYSEDIITYLSPYDFYKKECFAGCQKSTVVKIKCSKGYTPITAQDYDEIASIIKPNYMVTMTQYPSSQKGHQADSKLSNKSHKRAIVKTTTYLQKSKLIKESHQGIKILGSIHGASNLSLLSRSLEQILDFQVDGFVICDLCDKQTLAEREQIYSTIHQRLAQVQNKKFVLGLAGMGKIQDIEHGLKHGITIFQVNYPFFLAEQQRALIKNQDGTYCQKIPVLSTELKPLDPNCKCYSCLRHSQSYIAHLINCFQLNAKVLLSIHNIQVYMDYLQTFN